MTVAIDKANRKNIKSIGGISISLSLLRIIERSDEKLFHC